MEFSCSCNFRPFKFQNLAGNCNGNNCKLNEVCMPKGPGYYCAPLPLKLSDSSTRKLNIESAPDSCIFFEELFDNSGTKLYSIVDTCMYLVVNLSYELTLQHPMWPLFQICLPISLYFTTMYNLMQIILKSY